MIWYIPTQSGDFRLAALKANTCRLTIVNPTEAERKLLRVFIVEARERKWLDVGEGFALTGRTTLILQAPVTEAAPLLAPKVLKGIDKPWTALRSKEGRVELLKGRTVLQAAETALEKQSDAAVTIRKPARGCPSPCATNRRASQVLTAFSTAAQMREWNARGRMTVYGNATGAPYHVWHRDEAARRRLFRGVTRADTGQSVCLWDWTVPAEEEALSMKIALEHAEADLFEGMDGMIF